MTSQVKRARTCGSFQGNAKGDGSKAKAADDEVRALEKEACVTPHNGGQDS